MSETLPSEAAPDADWLAYLLAHETDERVAVALKRTIAALREINALRHQEALLEAKTQRGITDCSTPLPQRVDNIVEALAKAEAENATLRAQLAEARAQMKAVVAALEDLVEESYTRVEPPSWVRPATGKGVYRCLHCDATKGERVQAHAMDCAVGCAEKVLARCAEGQP